MGRLPLKGITVLDFGAVIAGPYGGRLLQTLGATVIRIESSKHIDPVRLDTRRPGADQDVMKEGGWGYYDLNRGKLDFALNTKSPKGMEIFHELVKKADVVCANYTPRGFHKMGLDYESLKQYNEQIIAVNASGLGDNGPYAGYASYAPIMHSLAGLTSLVGYDGEAPYGYAGIIADPIGGANLAAAIVGALEYRRRTGKGQFVDMSSTESMLCQLGTVFMQYQINGINPTPCGNHHYAHQMSPHNCYPCAKDNTWCVIAVGDDDEWNRFKDALRAECPWVDDAKFATAKDRIANEAELDDRIAQWTKTRSDREAAMYLQNAGVSAGMVQDAAVSLSDEHAKARDYFREIDFGEGEAQPRFLKITGPMINIASAPKTTYAAEPTFGQDNEYILKNILGMNDEEIQTAVNELAFI